VAIRLDFLARMGVERHRPKAKCVAREGMPRPCHACLIAKAAIALGLRRRWQRVR